MDKYRPKRPTTLALFPQLPQAGTQDSINNNSLGKKDSWKDSHSSSPHITGDLTPPDVQAKAEDKVRPGSQRRPAPKPPTANGSRPNGPTAATAEARARPRERPASTQASSTPKSQRRAAGGGGGGGGGRGRGAATMRERSLVEVRGKDGPTDRRGGRLCEEAKTRDRNGHQRPREANGLKGRAADGRGKGGAKAGNKAGGNKLNNVLTNQEVYLPAMVVPRTPVAPRNQDKNQDQ
ncbi:CCR4-NOT transcription complex subunit 3-like, partial [Stegastes partitus]|uniref:CCR4-NOT transcription complex subunit 3-like n=1 Tax=Stegastes partitus TaxID=144197 RepID=A0A9Y4NTA7_9TELE